MNRICGLALLFVGCIDIQVDAPMICAQAADVRLENPAAGFTGEFDDEAIEIGAEVVQEQIDGLPEGLSTDVLFFEGTLTPADGHDLAFVEKVRKC